VTHENVIGNFLNMILVRLSVDRSEPCTRAWELIAKAVTDAQRSALVPFVLLLSRMRKHNPLNDPSRNILYQTMLDWVPVFGRQGPGALHGVLDKNLHLWNNGVSVEYFEMQYNKNIFVKRTVSLMLSYVIAAR